MNSSAAKPDDVDHLLGESLEGEFEITPSIYETARLVSNAPWLDGHASRLQYLCAQQTPDGSWGEPGYHLVPTLSATEAVLATAIAEQGAVNNAVSRDWLVSAATRGLDVLHRQLAPGAPVPLPDTVAIELIIPGLVARINQHLDHAASSARLDLPARFRTAQLQCPDGTSPALLERLRRAAAAGQSLPEKLSHTWEMLAPAGERCNPHVRLVEGSVACSPAATATWLGAPSDPTHPAARYLARLHSRRGGPVPVATPMPFFERAWMLSILASHGLRYTVPTGLLASLDAALGEYGAPAGPGLPLDADDTAAVLHALNLHGHDRRPDSLMHYRADDHFFCYPEERTPSPSTNAHALEALAYRVAHHPDEEPRFGAAIRMAIEWLLGAQRADGSWTDKWHGSAYYATACCAQALAAYGGPRSRPAVARAVAWTLNTQHAGGGWGHRAGTVEEAAYAAWILKLDRSQQTARVEQALSTAERILSEGDVSEQSPTLWIGKDVYTPLRIVRVTRLAALHDLRTAARQSMHTTDSVATSASRTFAPPPIPCPFPDRSSPHGRAAETYVQGVAVELGMTDPASVRVLHGMALGEAAALTYPDADADRLRVAAMWIAFLVLFDDAWSDMVILDGDWLARVLSQHRAIHEVLDGRPATAADDRLVRLLHRVLVEIAALDLSWDSSRFRHEIKRYLAATLWELDLRKRGQVPDVTSYLRMRRVFSTMTVQIELDFFVCRMDLAESVRTHPCVQLADAAVADYGCLCNDLYSLHFERAQGLTSNVVTVLQHEHNWNEREATEYARRLCAQALTTFQDVRARLSCFGLAEDEALRRYFDHYEAFMGAAARWPIRSARYRAQATSRG